ncbi:UDP-N-acetylglucosamine 2-epimerase [compost metagenome]
MFIYGTRPEIIKLAPVINCFKADPFFKVLVTHTGQHQELTKDFEKLFNINPDFKLNTMVTGQSLNMSLSKLIAEIHLVLAQSKPDIVLIQGDTATVLATAICCFNLKIKYGHVEAGLRSFDFDNPFPEEFNRKIITLGASIHFCPTETSKKNLLAEIDGENNIVVTGNTCVDAVRLNHEKLQTETSDKKLILITCHRRENQKNGIELLLKSIHQLLEQRDDIYFIWPIHPNPEIKEHIQKHNFESDRFITCNPLNYLEMLEKIKNSFMIWTDSGGIQEESPFFKKPLLILRKTTERPEIVDAGFGILTDTDPKKILQYSLKLLNDEKFYVEITSGKNPFGDGHASEKILLATKKYLLA